MKARKFINRDRTTVGRGTGTLLCRILLPATGEEYDWQTPQDSRPHAIGMIRKFVERRLPKNPDFLIDASFVIEAEIRGSATRLGRKRLAVWKFGDSLASTFETVLQEWESLEFEEDDHAAVEIEI